MESGQRLKLAVRDCLAICGSADSVYLDAGVCLLLEK